MPKRKKDQIVKSINDRAGDGVAFRASDLPDIVRVPSGIYSLDLALGGGFPCGPAIMVQGHRNTGKSSLCFRLAANAEEQFGKPAVIISSEGPIEVQREWMYTCGISDNAIIVSEKRAEVAMQIARDLLSAEIPSAMVIDSVAAMRPSDEFKKDLSESTSHGGRAVLYNRFFNTLQGFIKRPPPLFLFTQHLYQSPGRGGPYISGGVAQGYIAKLVLRFDAPKPDTTEVKLEKGTQEIAPRLDVNWRIEKNHCGGKPDGTRGMFSLFREDDIFPAGTFSDYKYAAEAGWKAGLITPRGSWYTYHDEKYHGESRLARAIDVKECVDAYEASLASHRARVRSGDSADVEETLPEDEDD